MIVVKSIFFNKFYGIEAFTGLILGIIPMLK